MAKTTTYKYNLPIFDAGTWHDEINDNWQSLDALLTAFLGTSNFQGVWKNSTTYIAGNITVDTADNMLYVCDKTNISASSPTLFLGDRVANPTYWSAFSAVIRHENGIPVNVDNSISSSFFKTAQIGLQALGFAQVANTDKGIKQIITDFTGAFASTTTQMVRDDTIPRNTEGSEFLAATIIPKKSSNILIILVTMGWNTNDNENGVMALFRGNTTSALATKMMNVSDREHAGGFMMHVMTAGTTNAIRFKVRAGITSRGTFELNGDSSGNRLYGGTSNTGLAIIEIEL